MKNVAIVEDENSCASVLTEYIQRYAKENGTAFNVVRFSNGREFIENYRSVYSVVFMDIQMPEMNGMDASVELRKTDKTVSLIFITNLVQFAQKGYEVDAVGFLVKPVSYYDFSLKFKKALDINVMYDEHSVTLTLAGGLCRVSTDKLMYVEIIKHRLYYHLVDDVVEVTGVLANAEKQLSEYGFLRCNNGYLVNPKFVVKIKGSEVVVGGDSLTISRSRRSAFLAELSDWYAGKGR